MTTHYEVLDISRNATQEEVREAYRAQVKRVHPDLHGGDPGSVERMKRLVVAWEVLRDPEKRRVYDRQTGYAGTRETDDHQEFDYATFLRERNDSLSRARLIFFDLLHDNPDEALQLYDSLQQTDDRELSVLLGREDFMDCAFLLAEEYEERGDLRNAFELYAAIIRFEDQKPYFRHFMADVYERVRTLVCHRMISREEDAYVEACLHAVTAWNVPPQDRALCHKRLAERYLSRGERRRSARHLQKALALDARILGVKKLQQDLGYFERV